MKILSALLLFTVARDVAATAMRGIDNDTTLTQKRRQLMMAKPMKNKVVNVTTTLSVAPVLPQVVAPSVPLPTPFPTGPPPTQYPTDIIRPTPVTPYPTGVAPTPYPTAPPPTFNVTLQSMAISTTGSNYDPAALLPLYSKDMAYELADAGAIIESLELSIDPLGALGGDRNNASRRLNGPLSQVVVVSGSMFVRFQYLDQVDAWKQSYLKTAKNSSVMTALFQNLSADTGLDITWESSVEASLFDVSVTLPPTMAATIDCPAADSASFFESNVVVSFAGNPDDATSDQLLALEQAFLESYNSANSLSSGICDTLFRVLTNVTINVDGSYSSSRRLKQELTKKKFTFQFRVIGSCRYCAKSTNLFYNDALRRTLLVEEDESLPRALQISSSSSPSDDCVCPVNTTERSPTVDEFFTIFNSSVSELQEAGTLTFIESIVGAPAEIDPVECSAEVNSFETEVTLEVSGNPDAITGNEKRSLEAAFETTYNTLIQGYCDPLFRNVAEVTISSTGALGSNSSTEKDGSRFRRKLQKSTTMAKNSRLCFVSRDFAVGAEKKRGSLTMPQDDN